MFMLGFSCYLFLLIYLLNKLWIDKRVRRRRRLILSERTERNKNNLFD